MEKKSGGHDRHNVVMARNCVSFREYFKLFCVYSDRIGLRIKRILKNSISERHMQGASRLLVASNRACERISAFLVEEIRRYFAFPWFTHVRQVDNDSDPNRRR